MKLTDLLGYLYDMKTAGSCANTFANEKATPAAVPPVRVVCTAPPAGGAELHIKRA